VRLAIALLLVPLLGCWGGLSARGANPVLQEVTAQAPPLTLTTVADPASLLDDLKRSPFWYVTSANGGWSASLRTLASSRRDDGDFLSRALAADPTAVAGQRIANGGLRSADVITLDASVRFGPIPDETTVLPASGAWRFPIRGRYSTTLDGNSYSQVALTLAPDVHLVVYEQGQDPARAATLDALTHALDQVARVLALPAGYRGADVYRDFYDAFFPALTGTGRIRFAGLQDRDSIGGVLEVIDGVDLAGVQVQVSHPTYCGGTCTVGFRQQRKAEHLGSGATATDRVFFLVEDNACLLAGSWDQQFGTFSGSGPFVGTVEILGPGGVVLDRYDGPFRGWER